jgi:hypothetical protein
MTTEYGGGNEAKTLREALKFFLEEDHYIDRLEAEGLKDLIMKDGKISDAERAFLEEAIQKANFDGQALGILKGLLERAQG